MKRGDSVPRYDRHGGLREPSAGQSDSVFDDDADAMDEAAQALREAEVEAVQRANATSDETRLEDLSIDELRALAAELDVPNCGAITEQDLLIAAIRERM
jgi:hypothetical protein